MVILFLTTVVPSGHWSSYYLDEKNQMYQVSTQVYNTNEWKSLDLNPKSVLVL